MTRFQQALDTVDSECTEIWATKEEAVRAQRAPDAWVSDFFKQKTAYEIMSGDWSSDVCSSD
eukprot:COSAG01_NODE_41632_length_449_cov_0.582857_2_plen_61_part_01